MLEQVLMLEQAQYLVLQALMKGHLTLGGEFRILRFPLHTTERDRHNPVLMSRVAAQLQALMQARLEHLLVHIILLV